MSLAVRSRVAQPPLPHQFAHVARRAWLAQRSPTEAIRAASEMLARALNAIAIDPATRIADERITADRRFSLALGVAVPLSLRGRPARPERFVEVERRVRLAALERGVTGPAGRALEAARLIVGAVLAPDDALALIGRAIDAAVEAEVLAACLQGRPATEARAIAEQRALDICNPVPRS